MRCPFCGWELEQIFGDFSCTNNDCNETFGLRGSEEIWQTLIFVKKAQYALEIARDALQRHGIIETLKLIDAITSSKEE